MVPVAQVGCAHVGREAGNTRRVQQHVAQRHLVLPVRPELRPHLHESHVLGDFAVLEEDMGHCGRHTFGSGTGPEQRV
jgi:hypothetical protein